jgi:PEGA domain
MSLKQKAVLLLALLALCVNVTKAQEEQSARERAEASFKAGAAAYAAGEYLAAIQALEAAYELTPLPAIAFSLAQAERRHYFVAHELSHLERAIALYRRYVTEVQSGGRRADALDALSQLEPLAAVQGAPGQPAREGTAQPTRLMITCEAPGARISLDGGEPGPSPLIREVEPGKHSALVEADGFFPARRELTALRGALILGEMPLTERPSTLIVAAPADADLYVDGTLAGQGSARVQLSAGEHRLAVAAKGSRIVYRKLVLARGQSHELSIALERTPQRKASLGLFIAGGAALATGIIFGGLAIHEEDQAQAFLDQQERGNVSSGQLASYHEHVDDRDLFRTLGIASMGGAAVLFISALLLRELDRPNAQDIQRDARSSLAEGRRRSSGSLSLALRLEPWFFQSTFGARFAQRF